MVYTHSFFLTGTSHNEGDNKKYMNINEKAVKYGTCDLQQIAKIDRLLKEERNKVLSEVSLQIGKLYAPYEGEEQRKIEHRILDEVSTIINQLKV